MLSNTLPDFWWGGWGVGERGRGWGADASFDVQTALRLASRISSLDLLCPKPEERLLAKYNGCTIFRLCTLLLICSSRLFLSTFCSAHYIRCFETLSVLVLAFPGLVSPCLKDFLQSKNMVASVILHYNRLCDLCFAPSISSPAYARSYSICQ